MAHMRWNPWLSGFPGTLKSYSCQDGGYFSHTPQIRFSFSPARPEEFCSTDVLTTEFIAERQGYVFIAGCDAQGRKGRWRSLLLWTTDVHRDTLTCPDTHLDPCLGRHRAMEMTSQAQQA